MNILSLNSRTLFLKEIDLNLHLYSIELPDPSMKQLAEALWEKRLLIDCVNTLGSTNASTVTYEKWSKITNIVLDILEKKSFREQISEICSGDNEEKRNKILSWIEKSNSSLKSTLDIYSDPSTFVDIGLRHYLLNPVTHSKGLYTNNNFLNYTGEMSLLKSIYRDLREAGYSELELLYWNRLTKNLNSPVLPSVKELYQNIIKYELSFAASPTLKSIPIEKFKSYCRGAAYVTISASALGASGALATRDTEALVFYMISAPISSLVFISIGPIAHLIEDYIKKKINR